MSLTYDTRAVNKLMQDLEELPEQVFAGSEKVAKQNTPIRSGNARSETNLKGTKQILSDYDYADRLNTGWSKQAPKGFTDPTIDEFEQRFYKQVGRL